MAIELEQTSTGVDRTRVASELVAEFRARTPRSAELAEAAKKVMPGGDTRTVAFHAPYPLTVDRGRATGSSTSTATSTSISSTTTPR